MVPTDEGQQPRSHRAQPRRKRWARLVGYVKRKLYERKRKKEEESPVDRAARISAVSTGWMAAFTLILMFVGVGTYFILTNQLHEMQGSGTQTDKIIKAANLIEDHQKQMVKDNKQVLSDNRDALAGALTENRTELEAVLQQNREALERQTAALNGQLAAIERARKTSESASRDDQRAWLGVGDNTYTIAETGPIDSSVIVLNTGRSPALDIFCRITGTTKPKGHTLIDSDIVYPADLSTVKEGTIFPNQHFPLKAGGPLMNPGKQKIWFANVQSGEWIQYCFGDVRYKDAFGNDHWTHFCSQFVPTTKSGTPCPIYTDTDEVKK
jgi:hypothetical protein